MSPMISTPRRELPAPSADAEGGGIGGGFTSQSYVEGSSFLATSLLRKARDWSQRRRALRFVLPSLLSFRHDYSSLPR
jgi:hypothetical protein